MPVRISLKLLTLSTCDKTGDFYLSFVLPTLDGNQTPGNYIDVYSNSMIQIFPINPPLVWRKKVLDWFQLIFPEMNINNLKIDSNDLDAVKLFFHQALKFKVDANYDIILSDKVIALLNADNSSFLIKHKNQFLTEDEFNQKNKKNTESKNTFINIIQGVAVDSTLSHVDLKVYQYLLGNIVKAFADVNAQYLKYDEDHVSKMLSDALCISKDEVLKSLKRFIKRNIIYLQYNQYKKLSYFFPTLMGPIDLLFNRQFIDNEGEHG